MRELCDLMHVVRGQPLVLFLGTPTTCLFLTVLGNLTSLDVLAGWWWSSRDLCPGLGLQVLPPCLAFPVGFRIWTLVLLLVWANTLPTEPSISPAKELFWFFHVCPGDGILASPRVKQALCVWAPSPTPREIFLWHVWHLWPACQLWVVIFSLLPLPDLLLPLERRACS